MNCHDLDHDLDALLDERGAAERDRTLRAVDDHLRACGRCRRRYGALLDWMARLERGPDVALPAGLAAPSALTVRRSRGGKRAIGAGLAAAVLIAAGLMLMRSESNPTADPGRTAARPPAEAPRRGALRAITPSRLERRETTVARVGTVRIRSVYRTLSGGPAPDADLAHRQDRKGGN
jgi:hypothetical protein